MHVIPYSLTPRLNNLVNKEYEKLIDKNLGIFNVSLVKFVPPRKSSPKAPTISLLLEYWIQPDLLMVVVLSNLSTLPELLLHHLHRWSFLALHASHPPILCPASIYGSLSHGGGGKPFLILDTQREDWNVGEYLVLPTLRCTWPRV